ncbi:mast cell protease 4-like [Synchiropus splendidus]|uniref:mast cell protease 4-like n=1 Tax=Synchiropus splendidus TaxID=270530 RepID=UPI00237ECAFC|nr:mast cell protease 4-like [Synchiropus splendidus]
MSLHQTTISQVLNKSKAETEAEKCSQLLTKRTMLSPSLALLVFIFTVKSGDGAQIIGGAPVAMPSMALVEGRDENGKQFLCGGTLIDKRFVLTAAHCARKEMNVTLGVHSRKGKKEKPIKVTHKKIHPWYDESVLSNNLMLLQLQSPVKETKAVKSYRIKTPPNYPGAGKTCLVAGWGLTGYGTSKPSDVLMAANVKVIDLETCNSEDFYDCDPSIKKDVIYAGCDGKKQCGVWKVCKLV